MSGLNPFSVKPHLRLRTNREVWYWDRAKYDWYKYGRVNLRYTFPGPTFKAVVTSEIIKDH
jgi:hypothetical protein